MYFRSDCHADGLHRTIKMANLPDGVAGQIDVARNSILDVCDDVGVNGKHQKLVQLIREWSFTITCKE
jgi:urease accessory protein UreE